MELKDLKPAEGSKRNRKRVGRGPASGNGKTAGRGMNGQKSRAGGGKGAGFEGGQTPLARRLPKLPGFRNFNRVEYVPVNVSRLVRSSTLVILSMLIRSMLQASSRTHRSYQVLGEVRSRRHLPFVSIRFLLLQKQRSKQSEERLRHLAKFAGTSVQGSRAEE